MVYEELSKNMKSFEVVLINIHEWDDHIDEDSFQKAFKTMPWLAFPFNEIVG